VGRTAYDWAAETTIYLRQDKKKQGLGRLLYETLERLSQAQNILNLNACIGYPETEDEYLTKNSAQFHEHMGFSAVGEFHSCGYKFGRWYNMIWMEKMIGGHTADPRPVVPFPELSPEALKGAGLII
jgi:phosphinothricin acetyltransferase